MYICIYICIRYTLVRSLHLVGLYIAFFVKTELVPCIRGLDANCQGVGFMGKAVYIYITYDVYICRIYTYDVYIHICDIYDVYMVYIG